MRFRSVVLVSVLLPLTPLIAMAQPGRLQLPDFSGLASKASNSVDISLDPSMLGLAGRFLNADSHDVDRNSAAVKELISGLQGIYVRAYKFDRDDAYSKTDVDAVRAQLVAPGWKPLVSTHDLKQHNDVDIYVRNSGGRTEGMAIISSQPRALTIVNIVGSIDLAKLGKLQGQFGVPRLQLGSRGVAAADSPVPAPTAPTHPAPAAAPDRP